jgi:membrane protein implicated in regulation of membrane protease activity
MSMFWSWIAIAIVGLLLALLTGRGAPFVFGVGAAVAAWLAHTDYATFVQVGACALGAAAAVWILWTGSRR